jgi:hypothetical protein
MQRRIPDISKIQHMIGYKPTVAMDQILAAVIAFYQRQGILAEQDQRL